MGQVSPLIIVADGIGSTLERSSNVVDHTVDAIVASIPDASVMWAGWTAGYGPVGGQGRSWDHNATEGARVVLDIIDSHQGRPIILVGYSGGCLVVRRALERTPVTARDQIISVALLSDPFRPAERLQQDIMKPTRNSGVCGGELVGDFSDRTFWTTHPLDPISNAAPDSLLRTVADLTDNLGTDTEAFFADVHETLHKRTLQLWRERESFARNPIHWLQTIVGRVDRSFQEALNYGVRGYHTSGYIDPWAGGPGLATRLGASAAWRAKKALGRV